MASYAIFTHPDRCISCHACEMACNQKHDLPEGVSLGKIVVLGPELVNGAAKMKCLYLPCFQCEDAWCIKACPADAIRKRESDSVIYILEELCFGCQACIQACPWQIPQWNEKTGLMMKCDLCLDRLDTDQEPLCVTNCPTGALEFGKPVDMSNKTKESYGLSLLKQT